MTALDRAEPIASGQADGPSHLERIHTEVESSQRTAVLEKKGADNGNSKSGPSGQLEFTDPFKKAQGPSDKMNNDQIGKPLKYNADMALTMDHPYGELKQAKDDGGGKINEPRITPSNPSSHSDGGPALGNGDKGAGSSKGDHAPVNPPGAAMENNPQGGTKTEALPDNKQKEPNQDNPNPNSRVNQDREAKPGPSSDVNANKQQPEK